MVEGAVPIGEINWRQKAKIAGRVTSVEVQPWQGRSGAELYARRPQRVDDARFYPP